MLPVHATTLLALLLGTSGAGGEARQAPRLEVLSGNLRVFAGEAWVSLAPGEVLPDAPLHSALRLGWDTRARLTLGGAGVELRGPLEVDSDAAEAWTLSLSGSGGIQVDARSATLHVELQSTACLNPSQGVYWASALPDGAWRVGCEAGEDLVVRPPAGSGWPMAPRVESGSSLRIVPVRTPAPMRPELARRFASPAWNGFSWPWTDAR